MRIRETIKSEREYKPFLLKTVVENENPSQNTSDPIYNQETPPKQWIDYIMFSVLV